MPTHGRDLTRRFGVVHTCGSGLRHCVSVGDVRRGAEDSTWFRKRGLGERTKRYCAGSVVQVGESGLQHRESLVCKLLVVGCRPLSPFVVLFVMFVLF